jgi:Family of unknown function (DUF6580)
MHARLVTLISIVFAVALLRYLPHPPNVSPIAAIALFGGAVFSDKRAAFAVPFIALFITDLIIGLHNTMVFVYGAFALTVVAGIYLKQHMTLSNLATASIGTSVMFFLLTNFGVWVTSTMYPMSLNGLMQAYAAAIPFFQNSLLGNIVYTALLFGGYAYLQKHARWMQVGAVTLS